MSRNNEGKQHKYSIGVYNYHFMWYIVTAFYLVLMAYGSSYALWYEHTYYLHVNPFVNTVIYVATMDALLLVNPVLIFLGIRIGYWAIPLSLFVSLYLFASFSTDFDVLLIASWINILLSVPKRNMGDAMKVKQVNSYP